MARPLYCSPEMIQAELPIDLPAGAFDNADLVKRIELWSGYIDDYLAGQYEVPFPPYPVTPATVQVACVLLVVHYSYIIAGVPTEKEDPRQSLWGRAHDILDKVRGREIILNDQDGDPLTNPLRSTLPLSIGPAQGIASLAAQTWALGPLRPGPGLIGNGPHGGFATAGDDGWPERP